MPLPSDEQLLKIAHELLTQLKAIFGKHPGFRPAHAKGILLHGTFTPTPTASTLSCATHFTQAITPILLRYSNGAGVPTLPDSDPRSSPRGLAIRFQVGISYPRQVSPLPPTPDGKRAHTDIISQSTPLFAASTGPEFLGFLRAQQDGTMADFLSTHPTANAFVNEPKSAPSSYVREQYFGVFAFKLVSKEGKETFVRYQIMPSLGVEMLSAEALASQSPDYLQSELKERLAKGSVELKLVAQIAEQGDVTDDNAVHWPKSREIVELGTIKIEGVEPDGENKTKNLIMDPIPRIKGVEPSDDPLLAIRGAVYLISGRERRAA